MQWTPFSKKGVQPPKIVVLKSSQNESDDDFLYNIFSQWRALVCRLRGSFIITQKENKGEYRGIHCNSATSCAGGSIDNTATWYWNNDNTDTYAHVFDQNGKYGTTNNIPIRYANNSTNYYNTNNIPQCNDFSITNGKIYNTSIANQYSCDPYLANPGLNAGNWYNFPAATAGSDNKTTSAATNMSNSICPKGWQLPPDAGDKSYNTLIRATYNISSTTSDADIFLAPLSFVRLGYYRHDYGSLSTRGSNGKLYQLPALSPGLAKYGSQEY